MGIHNLMYTLYRQPWIPWIRVYRAGSWPCWPSGSPASFQAGWKGDGAPRRSGVAGRGRTQVCVAPTPRIPRIQAASLGAGSGPWYKGAPGVRAGGAREARGEETTVRFQLRKIDAGQYLFRASRLGCHAIASPPSPVGRRCVPVS